jgi:hypothetical protein
LHQVAAVGFKYLLQRSRRTIRKVLYRPGGSADEPFADRLPECGDAAGCRLGHTGRGEAVDERLVVDGHGLDRPARELAQERRHVALTERLRPGDA